MAKCISCATEVKFLDSNPTGLCSTCYASHAAKEKKERENLLSALVKKVANLDNPDFFGIGYWGAVNRQTVGKDMAQAALSGAIGMGAPFLVQGSSFIGHIGLITFDEDDLLFIDFGISSLSGTHIGLLEITEEHIRVLLQSEVTYDIKRIPLSTIKAQYEGQELTVIGDFDLSISFPVSDVLENTSTSQTIAYKINGISALITSANLIDNLVNNQAEPTNTDLQALAESDYYMKEFFEALHTTNINDREKVLSRISTFPEAFVSKILPFLEEKSKGADRLPVISLSFVSAGAIGLCYGIYLIIWIIQHPMTGFEIFGVQTILINLISLCSLAGGLAVLLDHKIKQWYRDQLAVFLRATNKNKG
jgi:hypothetical protein